MRALLAIGLFGVVGAGCSCGGGAGPSALTITVGFQNSASNCVAAGVQLVGSNTVFLSGKAIPRGSKNTLVFGVESTATLKGKVIPIARGYRSADCASVALDTPDESTAGAIVDLDKPGVQAVSLTLSAEAGTDAGEDGGFDAGGDDAGVVDGGTDAGGGDAGLDGGGDAGCVPAAMENCLDGVDNTCDGLIDCADPGCNTRPCVGGGTCGTATDGGRACLQPVETLCADGMDNDGDGRSDCADPDCAGKTCDDGNACTSADLCNPFTVPDGGGFCDGGASKVCTNALPNCRAASGVCVPATGSCSFAPLDGGEACDDGNACSYGDQCNSAAACTGVTYTCNGSQCIDAGTCLGDGGCAFVYASTSTLCDDSTACTFADKCDGLGICTGTIYSCAAPPVCFSGTTCLGDGGCAWSFTGVDSGCPGGTCGQDAGCVPFTNVFAYPPSNFDPAFIPDASIAPATVFTGCTVEFDSTNNVSADGGWCGQVKPTPFVFNQDGGISTTLLAMSGFTLAANSSLVLYGNRPVILAVFGPADLQGTIDARALDFTRPGPGGSFAGCGAMNGQNAANAGGGGGAAFGTAGTPGAGTGSGAAGVPSGSSLLKPLRGGCRGGTGHDSDNILNPVGGAGGGAFQLSSSSTLTVGGTLSTSGGGGQGGTVSGEVGGGGAGSGGAVLLEAAQLNLTSGAKLICNGGGGGGGRVNGSGVGGAVGQNGALNSVVPALGGQGGTAPAGDGGSGAAGATPAGNAASGGPYGSGGGGAGLGVIRLNGVAGCTIADGGLFSGSVSKSALCP